MSETRSAEYWILPEGTHAYVAALMGAAETRGWNAAIEAAAACDVDNPAAIRSLRRPTHEGGA